MATDLTPTIETNAQKPAKAASPAGSVEAQKIPDVIAADRYIKGQSAQSRPLGGIRFTKVIPPGAA